MATWLRRAVFPARLPGLEVPELHDLEEAKIMLAERAATWPRQWMTDGLREALTEQIEEKFGSLDSRYAELIAEAPEENLKRWLRGILHVADASDLFRT